MPLLVNKHSNFSCILFFIIVHLFLPCSHTLSFNITRFDKSSNLPILYEGDASVSDGAIELNSVEYKYRVGRATYAEPVQLWDPSTGVLADFSTHFSFTIDTPVHYGGVSGNGLAFFLAPVGNQIPLNSVGGFLGLLNTTTNAVTSRNQLVVVEFDDFLDEEWDPEVQHVGINENSMSSAVYANWDPLEYVGVPANVWINYKASTKNLSVFWTHKENPSFKGNYILSYHIDLEQVLPDRVIIGFSAATGEFVEKNTIHSWDFTSNLDIKDSTEPTKKSSRGPKVFLIVFLVCLFFVVPVLGVGYWFILKKSVTTKNDKQKGKMNNSKKAGHSVNTDLEMGSLPKKFTYKELARATNDFAVDRRLGQGGSGLIYKGTLNDLDRMVAVKRVFADSQHSQSLFVNEAKIISRLIHRNLVQFIGWCHERGEFLLVYEYMPNGSLDAHLFGNRKPLPWKLRYKIALELASALQYLHEGVEKCVLHRDIKPENILLDNDFTTKLGDFGIAKLVDARFITETTNPLGTRGYIAPEYQIDGRASKDSDMFSFGVVALEIACGRRNYRNEDPLRLIKEVWTYYKAGNILDAADDRLDTDFDSEELKCLMIVGLLCTNPIDKERPSVGQVIQFLKFESPLPELPHMMHDPVFHLPNPVSIENFYSGVLKYATH
ncbi:kinase, putative [Ricinus communis]|uniref:Kinase, putative n=1 Tax=Ricinus communis TaxID=3988 RepID=B9SDJ4_RICCO|nr:kinase, putative [Ricinus communis]|eukprot:XP_002524063.1 L-type lectin-domain containing receptor kinase IX.1 [Ricinus communis]